MTWDEVTGMLFVMCFFSYLPHCDMSVKRASKGDVILIGLSLVKKMLVTYNLVLNSYL